MFPVNLQIHGEHAAYENLASSTKKLASGLRINHAADDASGLAVREMMRAKLAATNQGIRNATDAISMLQGADAALAIIDEKLIRMRELAEQSATGTYNDVQREIIAQEYLDMGSEISRIARSTAFNGIYLLDGSGSTAETVEESTETSEEIIDTVETSSSSTPDVQEVIETNLGYKGYSIPSPYLVQNAMYPTSGTQYNIYDLSLEDNAAIFANFNDTDYFQSGVLKVFHPNLARGVTTTHAGATNNFITLYSPAENFDFNWFLSTFSDNKPSFQMTSNIWYLRNTSISRSTNTRNTYTSNKSNLTIYDPNGNVLRIDINEAQGYKGFFFNPANDSVLTDTSVFSTGTILPSDNEIQYKSFANNSTLNCSVTGKFNDDHTLLTLTYVFDNGDTIKQTYDVPYQENFYPAQIENKFIFDRTIVTDNEGYEYTTDVTSGLIYNTRTNSAGQIVNNLSDAFVINNTTSINGEPLGTYHSGSLTVSSSDQYNALEGETTIAVTNANSARIGDSKVMLVAFCNRNGLPDSLQFYSDGTRWYIANDGYSRTTTNSTTAGNKKFYSENMNTMNIFYGGQAYTVNFYVNGSGYSMERPASFFSENPEYLNTTFSGIQLFTYNSTPRFNYETSGAVTTSGTVTPVINSSAGTYTFTIDLGNGNSVTQPFSVERNLFNRIQAYTVSGFDLNLDVRKITSSGKPAPTADNLTFAYDNSTQTVTGTWSNLSLNTDVDGSTMDISVYDSDGNELGVYSATHTQSGGWTSPASATFAIEQDGDFSIAGLSAGDYSIHVVLDGDGKTTTINDLAEATGTVTVPVSRTSSSAPKGNFTLTSKEGNIALNWNELENIEDGSTITYTVADKDGNSTQYIATYDSTNGWLNDDGVIDSDGNLALSDLTGEKYTITTQVENSSGILKFTSYTVRTQKTETIRNPQDNVLIHFGPGNAASEDYYYVTAHNASLTGLGLDTSDISTQDNAQEALSLIKLAIQKKDGIRAEYGAMQNRLENTIAALENEAVNLSVAELRISDLDIAMEMVNFVRSQIIAKSATAMLAQANTMPLMALKLME